MDILNGKKLIRKDGKTVSFEDAVKNKEIIALYFSAHWCPPCRMFTPVLRDMYNELLEESAPFEVIFVTSDRSEDAMISYMKDSHGDWLAVPFGDAVIGRLRERFRVSGIPSLVILNKEDGKTITMDGRADVQTKGKAAFISWKEKK